MRWVWSTMLVLSLAGCAGDAKAPDMSTSLEDADGDGFVDALEIKYGSDPLNATSIPDVMVHEDISFSDAVANLVGQGIPSQICPTTDLSSKRVVWTISAPPGNVTEVHAANLEITISSTSTMNDADLFVYGPGGELMASGTGPTGTETVSLPGHNPIGDYTIEVRACSGAGDVSIAGKGQVGWIPDLATLMADDHADDGHGH